MATTNGLPERARLQARSGLTFRRIIILTATVAGLALLWVAHAVFLLVFAGILFGIFLDGLARYVAKWLHVRHGWAVAITTLALFALYAGSLAILLPGIMDQMFALQVELPQALLRVEDSIGQYGWGRELIQTLPSIRDLFIESSTLVTRFLGALSTTVSIVVQAALIVVVGIYTAAEPHRYAEVIVRLFSKPYQPQAERTLRRIREQMWWWLVSVAISMVFITILTYIGLTLLGIPLALSLAILTGLLAVIPNFGHILAAILPTLLALMGGPVKALLVILLFFIIQFVESNVVTPLMHRKMIRLLPVIGIAAQLAFGLLFGFMGLLLADPLVAMLLVILNSVEEERDRAAKPPVAEPVATG